MDYKDWVERRAMCKNVTERHKMGISKYFVEGTAIMALNDLDFFAYEIKVQIHNN